MSQPQESSPAYIIITTPIYLGKYFLGLLFGALTDVTLTSLAIGSIFLGLATTPFAGVAAFFLLHTVIKMVNALSGAQVRQGNLVGNAIMRHAGVFTDQRSNPSAQPSADPVQEKAT